MSCLRAFEQTLDQALRTGLHRRFDFGMAHVGSVASRVYVSGLRYLELSTNFRRSRNRWVLAIPFFFLPFSVGGTIYIFYVNAKYINGTATLRDGVIFSTVSGAMFVGEVVLNASMTFTIVWRLFGVGRRAAALVSQRSTSMYRRIIIALVESGALITFWLSLFAGLKMANQVSVCHSENWSRTNRPSMGSGQHSNDIC